MTMAIRTPPNAQLPLICNDKADIIFIPFKSSLAYLDALYTDALVAVPFLEVLRSRGTQHLTVSKQRGHQKV